MNQVENNLIATPTNQSMEMLESQMPIENEANPLQNDTSDNLLIEADEKQRGNHLEDKLADLEMALQAFTPLDDALAAYNITMDEFNCYLDTLGIDAEHYLKRQYGLGLVSFRSNLAILAATKPTAAKLLYDDLVNRGLVGSSDGSNNNVVIKFEGDD